MMILFHATLPQCATAGMMWISRMAFYVIYKYNNKTFVKTFMFFEISKVGTIWPYLARTKVNKPQMKPVEFGPLFPYFTVA